VYQGQKVYLFRPSLDFLGEAQLKTGDDKKALFGRGAY
jgi:hypothetical protein